MADEQTLIEPKITVLEPSTAEAGSGEFILAVKGIGFTMHSQVFYGETGMATGMLGQDLLSAPLNPALYEVGDIAVSVKTGDHRTPYATFTLTSPPEEPDGQEPEAA